ncbi:MAG TPA: hypothetical protein PLQ48_05695, partial [Spirochaetota bacterium]|nr:hypothetical protein [Spirochaetota bacterium]
MRRIMSVLVLLTLLLGATGLFAASADWKGYFVVKYVNTGYEKKDGAKDFFAYFWQKLELYPSWKLSE